MEQREKFASRIGFILVSAGCAIGLGNVWRFPYITGKYGGAIFVLIYLFFLIAIGIPVMTMEFASGRASRKSIAKSFNVLEPSGAKWHIFKYFGMAGNYLLMMFYTTISGWMLLYLFLMAKGEFIGKTAEQIGGVFDSVTTSPSTCLAWMVIVCVIGFGICGMGLVNGVEKITRTMMTALFVILIVLVIRAVTLPNAGEGLSFYLSPNVDAIKNTGISEILFAAMGQAMFTLSIGMGSMSVFGSYIEKDRTLLGESFTIIGLDTSVAVLSGFIIFPACFAFGVDPGSGPGLVFVTLPNIFNAMAGGRIFGTLFFILMAFAALSTVIAVFENILSFSMDSFGMPRKKAVLINAAAIVILSIPCALGFSVLSGFAPLGPGTVVLDLEDFIVSNNILPIGSLIFVLFSTLKSGWGFDNFLEEANCGEGIKFPRLLKPYVTYVLPVLILFIFVLGYVDKFAS